MAEEKTSEIPSDSFEKVPETLVDGQTAPKPADSSVIPSEKQIEYISKLPVHQAKIINRLYFDDSRLQSFILQNRIRDIKKIEMVKEMEPDRHGFYITKYTITYKG